MVASYLRSVDDDLVLPAVEAVLNVHHRFFDHGCGLIRCNQNLLALVHDEGVIRDSLHRQLALRIGRGAVVCTVHHCDNVLRTICAEYLRSPVRF